MRFVANSLYLSPSLLLPQPARLCCLFAPSMTNPIERAGRVPRFHSEDAKTRAAPRSVAASRHREDASSPPQRRCSVAASRHVTTHDTAKTRRREQPPSGVAASQRCSVVKTRRRDETPATWQHRSIAASRRREDARRPRRRGSVAKSRHREDASSPPQRRSVATPRRREQPPSGVAASQRCSVVKTRRRDETPTWQHRSIAASRRREDARRPRRRGSVAKSRRRGEIPAAWRRRVAASRHREDESSPLSGVAVITESRSLSCIIFENQNANALPSIFLAKFSLMTPLAMPSGFPEAKNLLVLQSSSSSKILLYRKPVGDTGWLKYLYMIVYVYLDVVDIDVRDFVFIIFI